jgi:multiple sugar transport system substrate-binding protein
MEFITVNTPELATERMQAELLRFGKEKGNPVNLLQVGWESAWHELLNVAIYRHGADIAEIGSTWLESLVAMDALNPFSARDIYQIGSKEVFFPAAWQNVVASSQKDIFAIPFRADVRVIFYWKDLLEQAGVDASQAFLSNENMVAAFTKLQQAGIAGWIVPTNDTQNTIYDISTWLWGAGGDFLSADGQQAIINSAAARRGAHAYFDLLRFMPEHTAPFTDDSVLENFFARRAACTIAGPWLLNSLRMKKGQETENLLPRLGTALLPGPSFVGGTLLVSWKHSLHPVESVELISRLTSAKFQADYCQISGLLPVRQNLWSPEFVDGNEHLATFYQALQKGRGLPPKALWGMIEDRLIKTLFAIWQELYTVQTPGKAVDTLDEIIAKHFDVFATRLNITLSSSNNS